MRAAALMILAVGAAGSLAFTLQVGRHNKSIILIALFAVWVLSPFVMLAAATVLTNAQPHLKLILLVTIGSLAIYGRVALGPPRPQPAFFFLVVPGVCWLLIALRRFRA